MREAIMNIRRVIATAGIVIVAQVGVAAHAYTLGQLVAATKAPASSAFSSAVVRPHGVPQSSKWNAVLRQTEKSASLRHCLANANRCSEGYQTGWRAMMQLARSLDQRARVELVNEFFNRFSYRSDAEQYGVSDHWATPVEFMARGAGDCEDYAIAKYFSLKLLGFSDQDMRVVAGFDRVARIGHAVLTVDLDGTRYVLDNRSNELFPESRYDFQPILSMNEAGVWCDMRQPRARAARTLTNLSAGLNFR
jgi:predicted transglutaminase-like cysteine proteinase